MSGSDPSDTLWDDQASFEGQQLCQHNGINTSFEFSELGMDQATVTEYTTSQRSDSDTHLTSPLSNHVIDLLGQDRQVTESADSWTPQRQSYGERTFFRESGIMNRTASPFTSQLLAEDYNRVSIKTGLLKIYHDSLEGALSCWLTERNCPYTSTAFDGRNAWSSNWANRVVTRVCALDKAYSNTGMVSKHDQQRASHVLNVVMMAFAAQWSHTGQRGDSRLLMTSADKSCRQSLTAENYDKTYFEQFDDDPFGRNMQKSLWDRANKALCEASDNVSFRVIFAGIIFALTQRPMDGTDVLQNLKSSKQNDLALLYKIFDLDGPPIFLDVALLKLHDHHRKLEDAKHDTGEDFQTSQALRELPAVHRETFGLLYWLAVMFDTLSAAVNRRSFTVCDTDSNIICEDPYAETPSPLYDLPFDLDGWSGFSQVASRCLSPELNVWGNYFLRQKSLIGDLRKQSTRWPCSYIDAASCLADAAPVKVLLFRRVGQLQGLFYQRSSAEEIEKGIDAAMEVYSHWDNTYGHFIEDCVIQHESLPSRIQSWYILLAGHWNLALLILSDLIDKLDKTHVTMFLNRCQRESSGFTQKLRMQAAFAVSDLGRNSQSENQESSFSQAPDFHHAVNKAALLTEPWTMVLVRSFGYAGAVLAGQVLSRGEPEATCESLEARKRLQYCIDALWLLGKKSDMAMCAAQVLLQAVI
ncbi:hypothetical protein H2198_004930 [Neophaeococcomyces mojaviensis]|uniref:Uncharacterized protein n=1 Tax=Neophaeococcomyces mojaviensis TaxID=3383035 RepID=A0ACC3A7D4_9EURO|nr:hypothetical protein H2198_004930 [Knufia sp. JES_112]